MTNQLYIIIGTIIALYYIKPNWQKLDISIIEYKSKNTAIQKLNINQHLDEYR